MAAKVGTVTVPMKITISAGSPAREICTVTSEMLLDLNAVQGLVGTANAIVHPDLTNLRSSIARALVEAAIEVEAGHAEPLDRDRIYLDTRC